MRLFLELIIAAAIIAVCWEKSLKERANDIPWFADKPTNTQNNPRPTPAISGAWMWDPNRRSPLDSQSPNPSSSPSSWRLDPNYRSPLEPPRKSPH